MLKAKCIRRLGKDPVIVDDSSVVIVEDEFGNPIVAVVYVQPNVCSVVTVDDPDFNRVLAGLGVDKLVINEKLDTSFESPSSLQLLKGPAGFKV